jgi:hypothetical protein
VHSTAAPACSLTVIAWRLGTLSRADLWWRYLEVGGNLPLSALAAYLSGTAAWPATEHNAVAHALNEDLWDMGYPSLAPYRELEDDRRTASSRVVEELTDRT